MNHAAVLDLTKPLPTRGDGVPFEHKNRHPYQQRPYKPRHYGRGAATKNMVDRDFKMSRGNDKVWLETDNEVRIWVRRKHLGLILTIFLDSDKRPRNDHRLQIGSKPHSYHFFHTYDSLS